MLTKRGVQLFVLASASACAVALDDTYVFDPIDVVNDGNPSEGNAPITAPETQAFKGIRSDSEGADVIVYKRAGHDLSIDFGKVEVSPFWKWSVSDPATECNTLSSGPVAAGWDPCAGPVIPTIAAIDPNNIQVNPPCVHSGLSRPKFSTDDYIGKIQPEANGDLAISEFETGKPGFNVHSLKITLTPDGTSGQGTAATYFPSEANPETVDSSACQQVHVKVKITRGVTDLAGTEFEAFGQGVTEIIEVDDAITGDDLFFMSVLKANNGEGQILALGDGYTVWNGDLSALQGANDQETESLIKANNKVAEAKQFADQAQTECTAAATAVDGLQSAAQPELQGVYNWKAHRTINYQGHTLYDEDNYVNKFEVPPTHPGPFGWYPSDISAGRNAHEGNRIHEINCESDTAVFSWLGHGAIYTYKGPDQGNGYAFNGLWTSDMSNAMSGMSPTWFWNNFPGKQNADAYDNRLTICPGTKMEMECTSVFFNHWGNMLYGSKEKQSTREFFCVKNNQLYSDAHMQKLKAQQDAYEQLYASCPEKNPFKQLLPNQYSKEVFIIVAGSVNDGDHLGAGGNISSGRVHSEVQFDAEPGGNPWLNTSGTKKGAYNQKCFYTASLREDNMWSNWNYFPGPLGHQNPTPTTIDAECDPTLVNEYFVHSGVKREAGQHRDRAMDRGLEAMFTYQDNGVQKVYDRITYVGHSRGGAKVNYLATRHKNLYPFHNVRFIALGSMASFDVDFGHHYFDVATSSWKQEKDKMGPVFASIPKLNVINFGKKCHNGVGGGPKRDFAPWLLNLKETPFAEMRNEFQSAICEKVVIKKRGWFNDKTAYKFYFTTDRVARADGNKKLHFKYTAFSYYARGYDKLWY